jgi:hypothetical protein
VSEGWRTPSVIGHAHGGSGMRLEFGPHGDLFASFERMVPVRIANYGVTSVFRYNGISDGTWTAHGNSLRLDYAEPHALGFHFTTQGYTLDQDFAHASSRAGVAGPFTAVDYFVNGSRMKTEMKIPHGNGAIVIMFHRVPRS